MQREREKEREREEERREDIHSVSNEGSEE